MLTACADGEDYVEAADACRSVAYACRGCHQPVILHAGKIRPRHFQHKPDAHCAFGAKMSEAHLATQRALATALRARGVEVILESWLPGLAGDRRIDVLAAPADQPDRRVAIEVQQADVTVETIAARTDCYRDAKIAPLWLRLLDFAKLENPRALRFTGEIWIERFAARAWEHWIHTHLGTLWFCDAGTSRLWRGRFTQGYGWREGSEWYEAGGAYQSNPGGYSKVTRWVGLALEGPYAAEELRLNRGLDRGRRLAAWFLPPDDRLAPGAIRRELRTELHRTFMRETCELQQQFMGRWVTAQIKDAPEDWRTQRFAPLPPS
jgi:hypothetical protein